MTAGAPVALAIIDPDDPYRYLQIRGRVGRLRKTAPIGTSTRWRRNISDRTSTLTRSPAKCASCTRSSLPRRPDGLSRRLFAADGLAATLGIRIAGTTTTSSVLYEFSGSDTQCSRRNDSLSRRGSWSRRELSCRLRGSRLRIERRASSRCASFSHQADQDRGAFSARRAVGRRRASGGPAPEHHDWANRSSLKICPAPAAGPARRRPRTQAPTATRCSWAEPTRMRSRSPSTTT